MRADEVMVGNALPFDELLEACTRLEAVVNKVAMQQSEPDKNYRGSRGEE